MVRGDLSSFAPHRRLRYAASMALKWTKDGDAYTCKVPPDAMFVVTLRPKGDGRWTWEVRKRDAASSLATGVVASLGAAKTVSENFVRRSGAF